LKLSSLFYYLLQMSSFGSANRYYYCNNSSIIYLIQQLFWMSGTLLCGVFLINATLHVQVNIKQIWCFNNYVIQGNCHCHCLTLYNMFGSLGAFIVNLPTFDFLSNLQFWTRFHILLAVLVLKRKYKTHFNKVCYITYNHFFIQQKNIYTFENCIDVPLTQTYIKRVY